MLSFTRIPEKVVDSDDTKTTFIRFSVTLSYA